MFDTPKQLVAYFRSQLVDTVAPYLWSDTELYQYATQGEKYIAQRTLCLQDMLQLDVSAGEPNVLLPPSVVRIRSAVWVEGGHEHRLDIESLDACMASGANIYTRQGRPVIFLTGAITNGIRLYPIPSSDGQLFLSVYRTPAEALSATAAFSIPFDYRFALFEWMRSSALARPDTDSHDPAGAAQAQRNFEQLVDGFETAESKRRGGPQSGGIIYGGI